jgi:hypothetical protein
MPVTDIKSEVRHSQTTNNKQQSFNSFKQLISARLRRSTLQIDIIIFIAAAYHSDSSMSSHSYEDDSDEEEECRVCRGPAEAG